MRPNVLAIALVLCAILATAYVLVILAALGYF